MLCRVAGLDVMMSLWATHEHSQINLRHVRKDPLLLSQRAVMSSWIRCEGQGLDQRWDSLGFVLSLLVWQPSHSYPWIDLQMSEWVQ